MVAMNLNTNTYALASSASSAAITLSPQDANQSSLIVYNSDTTYPVFLVSGTGSAPTAVVPTSATAPLQGKMLGPNTVGTFSKIVGHEFISAISLGAGTGHLYVAVGAGE